MDKYNTHLDKIIKIFIEKGNWNLLCDNDTKYKRENFMHEAFRNYSKKNKNGPGEYMGPMFYKGYELLIEYFFTRMIKRKIIIEKIKKWVEEFEENNKWTNQTEMEKKIS